MAADRAADLAIPLTELSQPTIDALNAALPAHWSHGNPVDIIGDADRARYRAALTACLADPAIDGVLAMFVPQAITDPLEAARAVVEAAQGAGKPIITCWMGETQVAESRKLFQEARIPTFRTPESAVELFSHLSAYYRNRQLLLQTPGPRAIEAPGDVEAARLIIDGALAGNREILNEMESKAVLAAFRIPISRTVLARNAGEAMLLAEELGLPVALKIASPDITHKSDVGGTAVDARIVVGRSHPGLDRYGHMAIHPYPAHRVHEWQMPDGARMTIRPIRPEDAELEREFVKGLSPESKYFRFMDTLRELTPQMLARFTQIDYDREMAFIAVTSSRGKEVEIGVCRYVTNPDGESCEFAVVVADEWQGRGIAVRLMEELIAVAREKRLKQMLGHILASNSRMLKLVVELGFTIGPEANDPMVRRAVLALQQR